MTENALPKNLLAKLQSAEELLPPLEAVLLYRLLTGKEHPKFRELQKEWREKFSPAQDSSDFALGCEVVAYYDRNITGFTTLRNELAAIPKKPVPPEITASAPPATAAPVVAPKGVREKKPPKNPRRKEPVTEPSTPPVPEESATPALPLVMDVAPPLTVAPKVAEPVSEPSTPPVPEESATPASPPSVMASFIPSMTAQAKPAPQEPQTQTPPPLGRAKVLLPLEAGKITPPSAKVKLPTIIRNSPPQKVLSDTVRTIKDYCDEHYVSPADFEYRFEYRCAVTIFARVINATPQETQAFLDFRPGVFCTEDDADKSPDENAKKFGEKFQNLFQGDTMMHDPAFYAWIRIRCAYQEFLRMSQPLRETYNRTAKTHGSKGRELVASR